MRTELWVLAGALLLVAGAGARSYPVLTLGLLLLVTLLTARLWARYSLSRVTYSRTLSEDRVYAGETVSLEVSLTNAKPLALPWLLVEDRLAPHLVARDMEAEHAGNQWEIRHAVSIGPYQRIRWRYQIHCPRRGYHRIGHASLRSGDPFGFEERGVELTDTLGLLVYPRLLPDVNLDLSRRFPFEGSRSAVGAVADPLEVVGARPYAETDTLRQVHWRASARGHGLHSKVMRPSTEPSVLIFLDLASSAHPWEGINTAAVERAISTAATLAHRAHGARWAVGLHVNGLQAGTRQRIRIGAARGDATLALVMDTLARVPPYPATSFVEMLRTERRRLPHGATVALVTGLRTPAIDEQVAALRRGGATVAVFDVGDET